MEKFSKWRDKGTGISPFLPVETKTTPINKFVVDPLLLALKWPLFVALYGVASVIPKPAIRLIFKWLFSVDDIDILVEGVRKSNTSQISSYRPSLGEVVVSNCVSPLDVFVIFLISTVSSSSSIAVVVPWKSELYAFTTWQSLSFFFLPLEECVSQGTKFGNEKDQLQGKLVVLFAEGTPSNNKAIFPLQECSQLLLAATDCTKVAVLRYYPALLSLPVPHMTRAQYVSRLLTLRGKVFVKVKIVPLQSASLKACHNAFVENGLNRVELGLREKIDFYKYFQGFSIESRK